MKREELLVLPGAVRDFITYLSVVKGKSDLTCSEYASDLRTFFRFMKVLRGLVPSSAALDTIAIADIDIAFIATITLSDAYQYLGFCKDERGNSAVTRSRKVSSLRTFFHYLTAKTGQLDENPMLELEKPKTKKSLPKYLSLEQSIQLLKSIEGKNKVRDYAIITLFLNCGLRLAELVALDYGDIRDNGTMVVTGKGDKERTVYLNDACMRAVKEYLKVRPVDGVKDKRALFLSRNKQRISPKTVQHIVNTALEKAGLGGQGFSVHKLRHTAATLMYRHGDVDVLILKEVLGHENLGTTEIYTHLSDEQMKRAADSNPLSAMEPEKKA